MSRRETDGHSASQICHLLLNLKVHYCFHQSLFWATSIQSTQLHHISLRYILVLSSHQCLDHPSGIFPSDFPSKTLYTFHPMYATLPHPSHPPWIDQHINIMKLLSKQLFLSFQPSQVKKFSSALLRYTKMTYGLLCQKHTNHSTYPLLFWPEAFFIIVQSITDDLLKILCYLHPGGPVTRAIIPLMLRVTWWLWCGLGNNQELVYLMITEFIVWFILRPKMQVKSKTTWQKRQWKGTEFLALEIKDDCFFKNQNQRGEFNKDSGTYNVTL